MVVFNRLEKSMFKRKCNKRNASTFICRTGNIDHPKPRHQEYYYDHGDIDKNRWVTKIAGMQKRIGIPLNKRASN